MLTIYGHPISGPSNKVRYTAEYLGLEYEWKIIDLQSGEGRNEEYKQIHPAGKVPSIDDDGFTLFESGAICRYLCEEENSSLYPSDPKRRAIVNQWADFSVVHVYRAISKVVYNRVIAPSMNKEVDERSLEEGLDWLDRFCPIVDEALSETTYFCGDEITLADITLISILDYVPIANIDLSGYDAIEQWTERIQSKQFWKACQAEREKYIQKMD